MCSVSPVTNVAWTLLTHVREQAQHPQPDEEPIRSRAGAQPEHGLQRKPLWNGQPLEPIQQRRASWCRLAKASSISDSTPTARTTVRSDADSTTYCRSAVFPIPASPAEPMTGSRPGGSPRPTRPAPHIHRRARASGRHAPVRENVSRSSQTDPRGHGLIDTDILVDLECGVANPHVDNAIGDEDWRSASSPSANSYTSSS
jgi:hypothetical protein